MAALHLRDVHGVQAIDNEMVGKIKNLFTFPTKEDAAQAADIVLKEYNCDMDPQCSWRYVAMTEELISEGAAVHAKEKHGISHFTKEMIAKVSKSIHKWKLDREEKKKAA
jgi:predicted small metal-binding protein